MNFISSILQEVLNTLFSFTGDLGISIVIITVIVKLLLLPLSLKQKFAMKKQQDLAEKMDNLKEKYKNNAKELEKQMQAYSVESMKSMMGCSTLLLQMPIIYALYNTFLSMPAEATSVLIPWISSLNVSDSLLIIPCIYTLTMLAPNFINFIPYFKVKTKASLNKPMIFSTILMSLMLTIKTPVALGLYFITSSAYSLIEDVCFRIYVKQKSKLILN